MDAAELQTLAQAGETFTVEFKGESKDPFSDSELIRNVVCLTNGQGGHLLIGIEDDGRVTGARPRHGTGTDPARLQALIANSTQPAVPASVEIVRVPTQAAEIEVIDINVPASEQPVGTKRAEYVRRALDARGKPQCVPYPAHEMLSRAIDNRQQDYARLTVPGATWADLDSQEFERYRRLARAAGPGGDPVVADLSDEEIALALEVATRDSFGMRPLAGAVLLFGTEEAIRRFAPTSETLFQVFEGSALKVNETWHRPLLAVAESALDRLRAFNSETGVEVDLQRIAIQRLPTTVIRETVANALIHRDYTVNGPTNIQLKDNTFEVISMGGFPPGITIENVISMTRPRSPILSEAFKRVGYVERSGRGVKRVYEALLLSGRRGPDYSETNRDLVHVTIPLAEGDLPLAKYFAQQTRQGRPLSVFDLQVLFELKNTGPLTVGDIRSLTSENAYQVSSLMNRLVERGYVEHDTVGNTERYFLSSAVYRSLGDASAYVRVHGAVQDDIEKQILEYIRAHGSIRRREVAELCHLDSDTAGRVLARMNREGKVLLRGERRGAFYLLPADAAAAEPEPRSDEQGGDT